MIVRLADDQDAPGLIELARQVENWFGPMAGDPGFRAALDRHIGRGTALVTVDAGQAGLLGGLLFSAKPPPITCAGSWSPNARAGRVPAAPS